MNRTIFNLKARQIIGLNVLVASSLVLGLGMMTEVSTVGDQKEPGPAKLSSSGKIVDRLSGPVADIAISTPAHRPLSFAQASGLPSVLLQMDAEIQSVAESGPEGRGAAKSSFVTPMTPASHTRTAKHVIIAVLPPPRPSEPTQLAQDTSDAERTGEHSKVIGVDIPHFASTTREVVVKHVVAWGDTLSNLVSGL
jgi:hypothetical protein